MDNDEESEEFTKALVVSAYLIIAITVLPHTAHSYYIYSGLLLYRLTSQYRTDYCTSLRQCLLTLPTTFNLA